MATIEVLKKEDREDLIDFIDLVFSQAHRPHHFETLLPKLYGKQADTMPFHYAIRENGKLMSAIIRFPYQMQVGDELLKMNGIGSVSAHARARGKGYMKQIMTRAEEDMIQDNIDLSWLSGQRQRYSYFGYEICSAEYSFCINDVNLRHAKGRDYQPEFHFSNLTQTAPEKLHEIYLLHNMQPVHAIRAEQEFQAILSSWEATPYLIQKDQTTVGYLVLSADREELLELVLSPEINPSDVIFSLIKSLTLKQLTIAVPDWNQRFLQSFSKVAESCECHFTGNYKIYHYEKVLRAFLTLKSRTTQLMDGEITVQIDRESLKIAVENGIPSVSPSKEPASISLSQIEAPLFFFGMQAPHLLFPEVANAVFLQSWFPLSFGFSHLDAV